MVLQHKNIGIKHYVIIFRLKSGHELYSAYLYKLGILPSPLCSCYTVEGIMNYIMFVCGNNKVKSLALINRLTIKCLLSKKLNYTVNHYLEKGICSYYKSYIRNWT